MCDILHYFVLILIIVLIVLFSWIYKSVKQVSKQNQELLNNCKKLKEQISEK